METHVEVRAVFAVRVDPGGRASRLRVYGVAERNDQRIRVDTCVANLEETAAEWVGVDQYASAMARFIDPARTFRRDRTLPIYAVIDPADRKRAFLWVAQIDLLGVPAMPPVAVGKQTVPVNVRASYTLGSTATSSVRKVVELLPQREFDAGVLLVHGIGHQRRAETLSEWSAPLARWVEAWMQGATSVIATKLRDAPLAGWLPSLTVRQTFGEYDVDYLDRVAYGRELVRKALDPAKAEALITETTKLRAPTAEEHAAAEQVAQKVAQELKASAVGGGAEFREAYVLDVGSRSFEPSSVEMHVEAMDGDGYLRRSRWMLAESHWGESFWAPSFFRFARWCLLTAPVVLVHYITMARLQHKSAIRWFLSVLGLSASVALAQLAFVLLMVLWLIPWERLRSYVLQVQLALAGVVGDSYILLEDPVQRRAIIDRVQRDLNWLTLRCEQVVVIAHSQGAAVAALVLSTQEQVGSGNIHSFVTLGAGVQTLTAIPKESHKRAVRLAGWGAIGCAFALGAAAVVALMGAWPVAVVVGIGALVGLWFAAERGFNAHEGRPTRLPLAAFSSPWLDFFATKDLVPFGPLLSPENTSGNYRPKEVRNRDSYFSDHTTYWQNPEQVVGPLVREIATAAGFVPITNLLPDDAQVLNRLERARVSRLGFMRAARGVIALAMVMLLYAQWPALLAIGRWALAKVQSMVGLAAASVPMPELAVWLQALVILLPVLIYRTLLWAIFDAWTTAEVEQLLRRSAGTAATQWTVTFTLLLAVILAAAAYFVWPLMPWMMIGGTVVGLLVLLWLLCRVHSGRVQVSTELPDRSAAR
jgi:hypothetical protein